LQVRPTLVSIDLVNRSIVEFVIGGPATVGIANVPLANDRSGIPCVGENVSQRPFPWHKPRRATRQAPLSDYRSKCVPPGHQRRDVTVCIKPLGQS